MGRGLSTRLQRSSANVTFGILPSQAHLVAPFLLLATSTGSSSNPLLVYSHLVQACCPLFSTPLAQVAISATLRCQDELAAVPKPNLSSRALSSVPIALSASHPQHTRKWHRLIQEALSRRQRPLSLHQAQEAFHHVYHLSWLRPSASTDILPARRVSLRRPITQCRIRQRQR